MWCIGMFIWYDVKFCSWVSASLVSRRLGWPCRFNQAQELEFIIYGLMSRGGMSSWQQCTRLYKRNFFKVREFVYVACIHTNCVCVCVCVRERECVCVWVGTCLLETLCFTLPNPRIYYILCCPIVRNHVSTCKCMIAVQPILMHERADLDAKFAVVCFQA